jgi:sulfiredoxin
MGVHASEREFPLLKAVAVKISEIYIPADRRKDMDPEAIDAAAQKILEDTEERPIQVRLGKNRYVLVKGVNRLEAHKALGEESIQAYIVQAKRY